MGLLDIKNLNVYYGDKKILKDINLSFEKGKLYGILGPNGTGKSTLFKAITKLIKIKNETIYIDNKDINDYKVQNLAQRVSAMSQHFSMKFPYTVSEVVAMGRYAFSGGYLGKEDKIKLKEALIETELELIKDKRVDKLSGGEKQRVLLGKTLCQDTDIVLIDEGFSSMDIYYQIQFIKLLKEKAEKEDKLIIFIMHDLVLAKKYCDEILMLSSGEVYSFGAAEKVLNDKSLYEVFKVHGRFLDCSLEYV